jgi:hypothetical protein
MEALEGENLPSPWKLYESTCPHDPRYIQGVMECYDVEYIISLALVQWSETSFLPQFKG